MLFQMKIRPRKNHKSLTTSLYLVVNINVRCDNNILSYTNTHPIILFPSSHLHIFRPRKHTITKEINWLLNPPFFRAMIKDI